MPIFISAQNERLLFQNARANLMATPGLSENAVKSAVLTTSFLKSILPVVTGVNQFQFNILSNQTGSGLSVRPDEQRLNQQDAFYVSKLFFYLFKASSATAYNYFLNTYPNLVTYPTGGAQLFTIYNGKFNFVINNNVQVPAYPMDKFLVIPSGQLTLATNSPVDQFNGADVQPFEPNVVFPGTYNSVVNVVLPAGLSGSLDANTYLMFYAEGVLAQNVALGAAN